MKVLFRLLLCFCLLGHGLVSAALPCALQDTAPPCHDEVSPQSPGGCEQDCQHCPGVSPALIDQAMLLAENPLFPRLALPAIGSPSPFNTATEYPP